MVIGHVLEQKWDYLVAHACNPSTYEAEIGRLLWIPVQPELQRDILCQQTNKQKASEEKWWECDKIVDEKSKGARIPNWMSLEMENIWSKDSIVMKLKDKR